MEYFMSHILYIVIAAVVIAAVTVFWALLAQKSDSEKEEQAGCTGNCSSCGSFSPCNKEEKKDFVNTDRKDN